MKSISIWIQAVRLDIKYIGHTKRYALIMLNDLVILFEEK